MCPNLNDTPSGGQMTAFDLWVCKAVAAVSGIWPHAIADYSGERALTFKDCSAAACQDVAGTFFGEPEQAFAMLPSEVGTNKTLLH